MVASSSGLGATSSCRKLEQPSFAAPHAIGKREEQAARPQDEGGWGSWGTLTSDPLLWPSTAPPGKGQAWGSACVGTGEAKAGVTEGDNTKG